MVTLLVDGNLCPWPCVDICVMSAERSGKEPVIEGWGMRKPPCTGPTDTNEFDDLDPNQAQELLRSYRMLGDCFEDEPAEDLSGRGWLIDSPLDCKARRKYPRHLPPSPSGRSSTPPRLSWPRAPKPTSPSRMRSAYPALPGKANSALRPASAFLSTSGTLTITAVD